MDRINKNKIDETTFGAINKVNKSEVKTMEELIKKMANELFEFAKDERAVPEYGEFETVVRGFKNINKDFCVDEFWLEIMHPPKGIENYKKIRGLKYCASKPHSDRALEILLASGSKQEILSQLKEPALLKELEELSKKLSDGLRDL